MNLFRAEIKQLGLDLRRLSLARKVMFINSRTSLFGTNGFPSQPFFVGKKDTH